MQEAPTKRTILCVEPDAQTSDMYAALMGAEYQLTFAANAAEAMREANRTPFDVYLLEYWLPDWSGASLCQEFRSSDPHAPVIFCTASAKGTDRERALRAGASAYLVKPIDPQLLLSKLRALVALASAENARAAIVAERAVQAELARRLAARRKGLATALGGAERAARNKALAAFMASGGARAPFDRAWTDMLTGAKAATGFREATATGAYTAERRSGSLAGSKPASSAGRVQSSET